MENEKMGKMAGWGERQGRMRAAGTRRRALQRISTYRAMVDALDVGLLAIEKQGRVTLRNARAIALLAVHFPACKARAGKLPSALHEIVRSLAQETGGAKRSFRMRTEAGHLAGRLSPIRGGWSLWLEEPASEDMPAVMRNLGLTRREKEIMGWMMQGKSNLEIAGMLESRPRTVEKHVEHILRKVQVESRAAAIARIHGLSMVGRSQA